MLECSSRRCGVTPAGVGDGHRDRGREDVAGHLPGMMPPRRPGLDAHWKMSCPAASRPTPMPLPTSSPRTTLCPGCPTLGVEHSLGPSGAGTTTVTILRRAHEGSGQGIHATWALARPGITDYSTHCITQPHTPRRNAGTMSLSRGVSKRQIVTPTSGPRRRQTS